MYKYLPIEQAKQGDIVQAIDNYATSFIKNKFYIIRTLKDEYDNLGIVVDNNGSKINGWNAKKFKLIATKPGTDAKVGDTVVCIENTGGDCKVGDSFIVDSENAFYIRPKSETNFSGLLSEEGWAWKREYFVTLCKESEQEQTTHRNLAFYKRSETPWTQEEYMNIVNYTEGTKKEQTPLDDFLRVSQRKLIFDSGAENSFQYMWNNQENDRNFKNCTQVAYEDVFDGTPMYTF